MGITADGIHAPGTGGLGQRVCCEGAMARKGDGKRHRTPKRNWWSRRWEVRRGQLTAIGVLLGPQAQGRRRTSQSRSPPAVGDSGSGRQSGRSGNGTKPKKRPQPGFGW